MTAKPALSSSTLQSSFLRLQRAFTPTHGQREIKHESTIAICNADFGGSSNCPLSIKCRQFAVAKLLNTAMSPKSQIGSLRGRKANASRTRTNI
jgi:hypothetical protein